MPYPKAYIYVLALIPATILGFWPSYFSDIGSGETAFHAHGLSATLWILLLAAQSWSIHNKHFAWHRQLGTFSLALFPVFMTGFFMVFQTLSRKTLEGHNPFVEIIGVGIGSITAIAIITTGYLYYAGLRNRKNVQLHARYLLAIPFLFAEAVFGRVFNNFVPGLTVNGIEDVARIYWAFHLSELLAITIAMFLYLRERRYGRPFLIVSIAMVLQSVALEWMGQVYWWQEIFFAVANIPLVTTISAGIIVGALISWIGWSAPQRPKVRRIAAEQ